MNWGLWWAQIKSVIRLEMRKTFFAKRGLWVYLLALAPAALFFLDSTLVIHDRDRRAEEATTHPISREMIGSIKMGMSKDEVVAEAGRAVCEAGVPVQPAEGVARAGRLSLHGRRERLRVHVSGRRAAWASGRMSCGRFRRTR